MTLPLPARNRQMKDRKTGKIAASVTPSTDGSTLRGFVQHMSADGAKIYSDGAAAYRELPNQESVNHSVGKYVHGMAHMNGLESFWSLMKRGDHGTYHKMSPWQLDRYVGEFEGRHNDRDSDTEDQMQAMVRGMEGKRLRYKDLVADSPNPRRKVGRDAA